jgi:uncharacterized protein (TIGR00730 family)
MNNVLIFCGANTGNKQAYIDAATEMSRLLVARKSNVITGGGSVGLMGIVADAVLANGGTITGVIPQFLNQLEVGHSGLTTMEVVENMHERKALMHDICDAIIALPGGYGTFDELFESLTWAQLQQHEKPIGLLNTNGFYNHLLAFLDHIVAEGMLRESNRKLLLVADTPAELLEKMEQYLPNVEEKWIR